MEFLVSRSLTLPARTDTRLFHGVSQLPSVRRAGCGVRDVRCRWRLSRIDGRESRIPWCDRWMMSLNGPALQGAVERVVTVRRNTSWSERIVLYSTCSGGAKYHFFFACC